ncbi:unnamed protein product, partial [Callosobruchus maculatus]
MVVASTADKKPSNVLVFYVNGKRIEDKNVDPEITLLYYLRTKLRLCGTKLGCGEGGCGACTVMVSKYDRHKCRVVHLPVNACLAPVCAMHGLAVTTVEGIGSTKSRLHPVQERIAKAHGSQCGFCTPGIVMSMYTLLRNSPKPSFKELEVAFQGNLCRCTGYRPILEGYKTFTEEWEIIQNGNRLMQANGSGCGMGDKCCKLQNGKAENSNEEKLFEKSEFTPYHPSQEPIFPPELKLVDTFDSEYVVFSGKNTTWHRPTSLKAFLQLKKKFPDAKIVVGNTEVGIEIKFKQMIYPVIIQPITIHEMTRIVKTEKGVDIGASATLIDVEHFLREVIRTEPEHKTRIFQGMVDMLNWFAGKQIRSVGALGSNIMTGSPISDMIPTLMACRVALELQSIDTGVRTVILDNNFFVGYRKTIVRPDEVLIKIKVPFTKEDEYFYSFKQARRREDDIAIVNAAVNVTFEPKSNIIEKIGFGFGGLSFRTVTAPKTEQTLKGMPWNRHTVEVAYSCLLEDLPLDPGAPGGMIQYRKSLSLSLFFKAFLAISQKLQKYVPDVSLDEREVSGTYGFHGQELKSSQYFKVVPDTQIKEDALQRPIVHMSAFKQATGEAQYVDDLPQREGELYCSLVLSTKAHAKVLNIDETEALKMEGVHGFVSAKDIKKGRNQFGPVFHDEKVIYDDEVTAQGQILGVIVADNQLIAQKAAKKVKVTYQDLPVIVSVEDAIKNNSFLEKKNNKIVKGDVEAVFKSAPYVVEGECRMGGQEHFYLETCACLVIPKPEDDEIEIFSSTQNPTEITKLVSMVLDIPQNRVSTKVKRIGGGFGGKESRAAAVVLPIVIAAKKFNRPMRCMLDRDEDILVSGGRNPFFYKYKVGFDHRGKILGCKADLYANCGYSADLSMGVIDRAMTHVDNSYNIPAVEIKGHACKTNLTSNTAFRGFGGPQGMFLTETMCQHIADSLGIDPIQVSEVNLYKNNDFTYYNQQLTNCTLDKCWKECVESSSYYERRKTVQQFNSQNRYKKRGLSIIPTKYGIAFTATFLNQGGALVLVYTDGSVLISHGGVEIGQGLHTKMIQVASRALGISTDKIHISETATDKVPNASPTAASSASDLNGMAVMVS